MKTLFEKVAEARRVRDTNVEELRPRLMKGLEEFLGHMAEFGFDHLRVRLADENGLRQFFVRFENVEPHPGLHRVRLSWKGFTATPFMVTEMYEVEEGVKLGGTTHPIKPDDAVELWSLIDDLSHPERHAKVEASADSFSILLKAWAH